MREPLVSAGCVVVRHGPRGPEVLLVHARRASFQRPMFGIPKGLVEPGESLEAAARRETEEETGLRVVIRGELGSVRQKSGKIVHAFLAEGDFDPTLMVCNSFEIEWPPRSGKRQSFPECDRAAWFGTDEALGKINLGQRPLIEEAHRQLEER